MSTIYLVKGWSGKYDSMVTWIVRAEPNRPAAEQHIKLCLQQLEEKFDKLKPQLVGEFSIPADPEICINPFFEGSTPENWWGHGVEYEIEPVELNDGITEHLVLHRCHKFV